MEPATVGVKLASSAVAPLVKKLFVAEGPGAGLVDQPVRISGFLSFKGEKRTLTLPDLHKLAAELVRRALKSDEPPLPAEEELAVTHALADTLFVLGDLDMTDVQAVELGHEALAERLRRASGNPDPGLSADAVLFYERTLVTACLHILHFFTQRSTFVAHTLVEQSRRQGEIIKRIDELIRRTPSSGDNDPGFENRYLRYVATKHSHLTIYGIDLVNSPERWPLDAAYFSLEALRPGANGEATGADGTSIAAAGAVPAEQALSEQDRVLLRGVAGSGKTTLVQWLAVTAARGERGDRIPFVLPLRTLIRRPSGLPAPDTFLDAVKVPFQAAQPHNWADRVLTARRGLLLVDGIDEVPEAERERTRRWLRDLFDVYPGNQWLVTSRPSAIREDWLAPDGFTELALTPMSRDDVAAFISRWHTAARIDAPDPDRLDGYERTLLEAVQTKRDLGRLATNPLMCGLICALHRDRRGYLPHGKQELYQDALSMLLSRRDTQRDMFPEGERSTSSIQLTELPQIQLLQRLAYWLIRNSQSEMDRERAQQIVAEALPSLPLAAAQGDAHRILGHLLVRSGLLREPTLGTLEFVHRTFQDYLGARAAVEDGDFGLLVRNAADEQWADVIRMAVAHARPRERADFLRNLSGSAEHLEGAAATRVRLLALASLEHATELDADVRAFVEERAATLIPPGSTEEARALASVGPLALELLPGPEGLTEAEARAVVATASLIGTDAALPVLSRFRTHPDLTLRSQLAWNWDRFDAQRYGEDFIAQLLPDDLHFWAYSGEHLRLLRSFGGRPWLQLVGDIGRWAIRTELTPDKVTRLCVRDNRELRDLTCLSSLHRLTHLDLIKCPYVESLTPVAQLPLKSLSLNRTSGLERPGALDALAGSAALRSVDLCLRLKADRLDEALPQGMPLRHLGFAKDTLWHTGLRGLHRFASLTTLSLTELRTGLSAADHEEIARLPELKEVRLDWQAVDWSGPPLPGVTSLWLNRFTGHEEGLAELPTLFPGLRTLTLQLAPDAPEIPDHTLALLPLTPKVVRTYSVV
ncbi:MULTISPECIES: NACHT domain-containing NTPase [unclassified Streptomyces]|uniref:NACHT domain-containing protein n=1 Tax=unclassified Streptomyces TaxID=2593676 RepID=UPI00278BAFC9|nr:MULTISPECIES: NACHT domain-containing protein [unclassified Streptomyces]